MAQVAVVGFEDGFGGVQGAQHLGASLCGVSCACECVHPVQAAAQDVRVFRFEQAGSVVDEGGEPGQGFVVPAGADGEGGQAAADGERVRRIRADPGGGFVEQAVHGAYGFGKGVRAGGEPDAAAFGGDELLMVVGMVADPVGEQDPELVGGGVGVAALAGEVGQLVPCVENVGVRLVQQRTSFGDDPVEQVHGLLCCSGLSGEEGCLVAGCEREERLGAGPLGDAAQARSSLAGVSAVAQGECEGKFRFGHGSLVCFGQCGDRPLQPGLLMGYEAEVVGVLRADCVKECVPQVVGDGVEVGVLIR